MFFNYFTGGMPTEFGNLKKLTTRDLCHNALSGSLHTEIGGLAELGVLSLANLLLTGRIPTQLGKLGNLTDLQLRFNQLSGQVPTQLTNLDNLGTLDLVVNHLSGTIPTELASLSHLQYLYFGRNCLEGSLPRELGKLLNLEWLLVASNPLMTGTVPSELWKSLEVVDIAGTMIRGNFMGTFCESAQRRILAADCASNASNSTDLVICECCTHCTSQEVCDENGRCSRETCSTSGLGCELLEYEEPAYRQEE